MGFWDELKQSVKEGMENGKRLGEIELKIERSGSTACLTPEERAFYTEHEKRTPEQYLAQYQEKQARIAEKERIRALKQQETQLHIGGLYFRRGGNGLYYFGDSFVENAACWRLVSFIWGGPHYETITKTTGTTRPKGKLRGAMLGGAVAGFSGAFIGAVNGMERHTDLKTTVQQVEKDTVAYLVFESVRTGERVQKKIWCNTKVAGQVGKLIG